MGSTHSAFDLQVYELFVQTKSIKSFLFKSYAFNGLAYICSGTFISYPCHVDRDIRILIYFVSLILCSFHFESPLPRSFCLTRILIKKKLTAGQPRRHLLTTGWSVFVSSKKLVAGDAFIFLRQVIFYLKIGMFALLLLYCHQSLCHFFMDLSFLEVKMESCALE